MRHAWAIGLLSVCLTTGAYGQEKAPAAAAADLVAKLSHPRFSEREKANKGLETLGEPALDALRNALKSEDGEVRTRAANLIVRIERQAANRKYLLAPVVALKFQNAPLRNAVSDLNKKSGLNLHLDEKRVGNPTRSISIDTGDVPLWVAVDKFLAAAGLTELDVSPFAPQGAPPDVNQQQLQQREMRILTPWGGSKPSPQQQANRITLIDGKTTSSSFSNSAVRVRSLPRDFPGNVVTKGTGEIAFSLDVTPAPNLAWQGLIGVELRRAIDEHGQRLTQAHSGADDGDPNMMFDGMGMQWGGRGMVFRQAWLGNDMYYEPGMGMPSNPPHVPVSLVSQDRSSKLLKELEGIVAARVLTPPQTLLTIDDILKASANNTHRVGSMSLQILESKASGNGGVTLRVRTEMPSMMMNEMFQFGGGRGRMQLMMMGEDVNGMGQGMPLFTLQDTDGKAFRSAGQNHMNSSDNGQIMTQEMQLTFLPQKGQKDAARLVLTGRRAIDLEIPFSLKDVPLP